MGEGRRSGSRTLGRGLQVLAAVGERPRGVTVADVCAETGYDRAVVHRLLETLAAEGYVVRDPATRRFRLGIAVVERGGQALAQHEVRRVAQDALRMLQDGTREGSCLMVRDDRDAVVLDRLEPFGGGRLPPPIGSRRGLATLAHGRVILAFLRSTAPATSGEGAGPVSARPAGGAGDQLARIRRDGFAIGAEDLEPGAVEVAAPVMDASGEPVASLGVVAPAARLPNPVRIGGRVRTVASEVSRRLGWASAR